MHAPSTRPDLMTVLALVGATAGWGVGSTATRLAVAELPPLTLTCLRFGSGALLLLALLWWRGQTHGLPARRAWGALLILGLLGVTLFGALMTVGLQWTGAAEGTLIQGLSPLFTLAFASIFAGERARRNQVFGALLAFSGLATILLNELAAWSAGGQRLFGDVILIGSSLCWAGYNVAVRMTADRVNLGESSAYALLIGTALLTPFALLEPPRTPLLQMSAWGWIGLLYLMVVSTCLAYIWWNAGIRKIGAGRAAMFSFIAPVAAMVSAIPVLGEWPGPSQLVGGGLILAGLYLANRR
ncbi:MAG: DMT family transporter [Chloroflexi bacterium]|nr:DMT family transporter [Chloroflexota bacterium]